MTAIAGPSTFSLELVAAVIGVSMIAGAVDVIRQPGWAWKRARESQIKQLLLVLLLPLVGLGLYLLSARPKVAPIAKAGKAASLPFERFGEDAQRSAESHSPQHSQRRRRGERKRSGAHPSPELEDARPRTAVPTGVATFAASFDATGPEDTRKRGAVPPIGATAVIDGEVVLLEPPRPTEVSGTFFSTSAARYRPRQRTHLRQNNDRSEGRSTVPAGWKADPTGRHQFRYWDGSGWTENVADDGEQARDSAESASWSSTAS
jgi:Protein of unknown function (DUF2510)